MKLINFLLITGLSFLYGCTTGARTQDRDISYTDKWKEFDTNLILKGKSFQSFEPFDSLGGNLLKVMYPSDSMKLNGLLNISNIDSSKQKSVLVYLHGGFALRPSELSRTQIFTDNDFIVFAPSWRGENGNPGSFELFMGEVADTKSAINWISKQPYVDASRIYVFGWSVGGGVALNLALHNDVPIELQASSAGVYDSGLIKSWATEDDFIKFPYDYKDSTENHFRLPIYHFEDMVRNHITYLGAEDNSEFYVNLLDSLTENKNLKFDYKILPGDHVSSLDLAMSKFLDKIESLNLE